jgi:hypothetical protein
MAKSSREFVTKVNGKWTDAPMHEELLAGDHSDAVAVSIERARKAGLTEEEIELLYGKQPK